MFEKIIKSCKATNLEFLKLKEKLGLCFYEAICDDQELISMSKEIFKEKKVFTQHDVENKQLKEENEKLRNEENKNENENENEKLRKENKKLRKNNVVKDGEIKKSIEKPKETKIPQEDKNMTDSHSNWFDKNKFKNILAIIDSKKFSHKNKIGEFKYIDIKGLVNNIKNNTISEISAKTSLNTLNEVKNAEIIKYKKCTLGQKQLLNLFNNLSDTILIDKTLELESQENENENEKEKENEKENENDKTISSKDDDEIIKILLHSSEYAEVMNQNEKNIVINKKIK